MPLNNSCSLLSKKIEPVRLVSMIIPFLSSNIPHGIPAI
jgi:hypothetical protein